MSSPHSFNGLFFAVLLSLIAFPLTAQTEPKELAFFFAPLAEVSLNNVKDSPSFGGGFTVGMDGVVAVGLSCIYLYEVKNSINNKRIDALETTIFARVYVWKPTVGPFVQLNFGPVLYFEEADWSLPATVGICSAGLSFGWRFLLGDYFYIEPAVKGGYPFIFGGSLAVGVRL